MVQVGTVPIYPIFVVPTCPMHPNDRKLLALEYTKKFHVDTFMGKQSLNPKLTYD